MAMHSPDAGTACGGAALRLVGARVGELRMGAGHASRCLRVAHPDEPDMLLRAQ